MPKAKALTAREIDALTCRPGARDQLTTIGGPPGFSVRVTREGTKSFLLQYRRGKAVRRLVLGRVGEVSLNEARRLAEHARGLVAAGRDPAAERILTLAAEQSAREARKAARQADALTVESLVEKWVAIGLRDRSASHRKDAHAALARNLAGLWKQPAHKLTAAAVQKRIDAIGRAAPILAERVKAYGRAAFNWGGKRGLVSFNPFAAAVIEARSVSRERVLSDAELGAVWNALATVPYPFGPLLRVLLLTLQRKSEVAGMRWPEISADLTTWTLPGGRAKNGREHIVHLSAPVRAILAAIPRRRGSDLVFTTTGRTPVSGFSGATDDLRERVADLLPHDEAVASRAGPWRLHDFRRTGVTMMARLGVAPHVADKVLNHVTGAISGVAAIYQRHEFLAERAKALDLWAAQVIATAKAAVQAIS